MADSQVGPRITWAALDLGRVQARIKAADARAEASLAFYERTVRVDQPNTRDFQFLITDGETFCRRSEHNDDPARQWRRSPSGAECGRR